MSLNTLPPLQPSVGCAGSRSGALLSASCYEVARKRTFLDSFFEKVLGNRGSEAEVEDFMGRMTKLGNLAEVIGRACESSIDQTPQRGIERSPTGNFVLE